VSVLSRLRRLARPRCLRERLTTVGFHPRCCREVNVNGSKDRAKDASPIDDGFSIEDGCLRFVAPADVVPLLGGLRTSAVIGAPLDSGRRPASSTTDRPRSSFERRPAKSDAVPKTGMPFTVTSKEEGGGKSAISVRRFSRSRRPHVPRRVVLFFGHCKVTVAVPREVVTGLFEKTSTFLVSSSECLELTSQAPVRGRPARPSTRTDCLARIAPAAAP